MWGLVTYTPEIEDGYFSAVEHGSWTFPYVPINTMKMEDVPLVSWHTRSILQIATRLRKQHDESFASRIIFFRTYTGFTICCRWKITKIIDGHQYKLQIPFPRMRPVIDRKTLCGSMSPSNLPEFGRSRGTWTPPQIGPKFFTPPKVPMQYTPPWN